MSQLNENESLKLTATWINGISAAVVAAGIVLPILNQLVGSNRLNSQVLVLLICGCLAVAGILHLIGLAVLKGLE